jgi:hypothetical protein
MTLEQRLKAMLGEMQFIIAAPADSIRAGNGCKPSAGATVAAKIDLSKDKTVEEIDNETLHR